MRAIIRPSKLIGEVEVPTSKSYAHRALICAFLSDGLSIIKNVCLCKDIEATIDAITSLGAKVTVQKINNSLCDVFVTGISSFHLESEVEFDANESASTLRFLIPLCLLFDKDVIIKCKSSLLKRPLDVYVDIFEDRLIIKKNKVIVKSGLYPKDYLINGNISSQFISGLLFALPLLEAPSKIQILNTFSSKHYVTMTCEMLLKFGILNDYNEDSFNIIPNQKYIPSSVSIERDYTQASTFMALGAFNNSITIKDLNRDSLQGDRKIIDILSSLNVKLCFVKNDLIVKKSILIPNEIDIDSTPDLGPIVFALASLIKGKTIVKNVKRLEYKECNRLQAMISQLQKFGITIQNHNDYVVIEGGMLKYNKEIIDSHNDHRICMALTFLALTMNDEVIIDDVLCVEKSYPHFFDDLIKMGANIEVEN